jgi:hypothetical protein
MRSGTRTRPEVPGAVRIEGANEWAWCGARRLPLTPRAFAVLRHLVEHQGRLVTKDELLTTVWRDAIVPGANGGIDVPPLELFVDCRAGASQRRSFRSRDRQASPMGQAFHGDGAQTKKSGRQDDVSRGPHVRQPY